MTSKNGFVLGSGKETPVTPQGLEGKIVKYSEIIYTFALTGSSLIARSSPFSIFFTNLHIIGLLLTRMTTSRKGISTT